jgi:enolase
MKEVYCMITKIKLRKIENSKGEPTVEATVFSGKFFGKASTASGTSVGKYEAVFAPKPINKLILDARRNVVPKLLGMDATNQKAFDKRLEEIDGTKNFSKIGASISTALSMAVAKAGAAEKGTPLFKHMNKQKKYEMPMQIGKCIGGGAHAAHGPRIQEFLTTPITKSFSKCIEINKNLHKAVFKILDEELVGFEKKLDLEGGWTAPVKDDFALYVLAEAARTVQEKSGVEIRTGVDLAGIGKTVEEVLGMINSYNLWYVEDPFTDFRLLAELTKKAKNTIVCGDDVFATNAGRLRKGIELKACNAVIIKPNQVGTLLGAYETIKLAKKNNYVPIVSHRSGETFDTTISHLAVAFNCPFIKIGIVGKERTVKTKELVKIGRVI